MSNAPAAAASSPARKAPIALWRIAQACMRALHALFGAPEDIARAGWLSRATRTRLSHWLGAARAILARLLLIEPAAIPAPAPARRRLLRKPRLRRLVEHTADAPQTWRVSLRLAHRRLPAGRPRCRRQDAGGAKRDPANPWPLAERYEALLRAYNNPAPYAERLARRLHGAPLRAHALFPCARAGVGLIAGNELADLTQAAGEAAFVFEARARGSPPA
jgi:hypothetical protein